MGKVSNPYNFNIKDDYKSYADISSPDDDYNFIFIIGRSGSSYGYAQNGGAGTLIKNTTGLNISGFYYATNQIRYAVTTVGFSNSQASVIETELFGNMSIIYYMSTLLNWKNDSVVDYLQSHVGEKFRCNIR